MSLLDRILHRTPDPVEVERDRRLAEAEAEVQALRERAERAGGAIDRRHRQNHWQEAIDKMIHDASRWGKA